ncbi:DNA repair/transcription protein Met18p/MMS19 [Monosporozyma unispora]
MMSDRLESLLISFIANDTINNEKAFEISTILSNLIVQDQSIKLLDIILGLKEQMTSEDPTLRKKALNCLSSILTNLPKDHLTKNEITVIYNFYTSKLDDESLILESFLGFKSLIDFNNISGQEIVSFLNYLKNDYVSANYLAAIRFIPFQILKSIYINKLKNDNIINPKITTLYIETYINVASGEKDPRNLMISFNLNEFITTTLNITLVSPFKQQLFDILFSYFPITFKPPKNDPYKISNNDLKLSLRSAISSNDIFAHDAFTNLIDKMSASSPSVKNDTLLTLNSCINKFKPESINLNWIEIWKALKFEIMHSLEDTDAIENASNTNTPSTTVNNSTKNTDWTLTGTIITGEEQYKSSNYHTALHVVRSIALKLVEFDLDSFNKFATHILAELSPNFIHSKDLKQSCGILSSIASANPITFDIIIENALPLFLVNSTEIPKLKLLLMNLSFFLDAYMVVFGQTSKCDPSNIEKTDTSSTVPHNKLSEYKDEILMILGMALTGNSKIEVAVRTLSVIQFTKLVKMKGFLTTEEIALIIQYLTETILTDNNKNIYCACLEGLKLISEFYEESVYDVSLKQMLNLLPLEFNNLPKFNNDEYVEIETILKIILDFTTSRHKLIKESIIALTQQLFKVTNTKADRSVDYCFLILSTIYSLFENNIILMTMEESQSIKNAIEPILLEILDLQNDENIINDDFNFSILSNIFYFINLKTNKENHGEQLIKYNNLFQDKYGVLTNFPTRSILPYSKILSALDKSTPFDTVETIFKEVITLLQDGKFDKELEKLGYLELLMVLTNKWLKEDIIKSYINWEDQSNINLEILTWIGKGLVMENSSLAPEVLTKFIELLSDVKVGGLVARLFEIFVIDISSMKKVKGITWNNNVKLLYKQKFFSDIFKILVTSYKKTETMFIKCNYLTALSLVLKHTPSKLVEPFMNDLLPMLLEALEMNNGEVRTSSLETLKDVTEKFHQLVTDHVQTLIPLLLKLVTPDDVNNTILVRLLSLQLLEAITKVVPLNYCLDFKEQILVGTVIPLSDKKRVIRKQCIDTRQVYFELGQAPFE